MLIEDIAKVKYADEGYMPNFPPHLLSREELCDAFILSDASYFNMNYKCLADDLEEPYALLRASIEYHVKGYLDKVNPVDLPMWVWSYVLGEAVCNASDELDRHSMLTALNCDNTADVIDGEVQRYCYDISKAWCQRLPKQEREVVIDGQVKLLRPPTMFGEPHVLKVLRISPSEYEVMR